MLAPYTVDVPMERWPYANWALIAVTCVVSLAIFMGAGAPSPARPDPELQRLFKDLDLKKAKAEDIQRLVQAAERERSTAPPLALRPREWTFFQLFSCLFVHADLLHLIGNMAFLFCFGNAVNAKMGHVPFLVSYLLLGACASAAWLVLGDGIPAVGASGAIMGIVGVFLVLYPLNDVTIVYWFVWTGAGEFSVPSYLVVLTYIGLDLFGTLTGGAGGVAYVAHLGGAFAGIALASGALAVGWLEPSRGECNLFQAFGVHEQKALAKKKRRSTIGERA